jgi:hypothetical protein
MSPNQHPFPSVIIFSKKFIWDLDESSTFMFTNITYRMIYILMIDHLTMVILTILTMALKIN